MYDELNSFVSYVKDVAEGGSSKEMAYVLVGEPGNGKTFFVDFFCAANIARFLSHAQEPEIHVSNSTNMETAWPATAGFLPSSPRRMRIR
jgi:KaiC/GvpD/RAD55 family RecA-like ATPase